MYVMKHNLSCKNLILKEILIIKKFEELSKKIVKILKF
ncbi:hypothetical protein LEP1GSC109_4621 [Leptospira interrogans str. UI 13372]|nr:hypothetical protein LEP1GSC109_4621 [Leptospira interrogans str. UI 13372]